MATNLKNLSFYLVGPIDLAHGLGKDWRDDITVFLKERKASVIDPLDKPIDDASELEDRDKREQLIKDRDWTGLRKIVKRIRAVDLRFVDKADALIVNYDISIPMCGTFEEIFLANRERKPIILMCPQGKHKINQWMFGTLPHQLFFESWGEVKAYLNYIHKTRRSQIDTVGDRWLFFNRKV
jgi:nucleoside 2-deoxyribosyltransferase